MERTNLVIAQCRSGIGYHILYATLVHGDDIRVALHHIYAVFLCYSTLGLIDTIELAFLMEYIRIGRVDIFLLNTLCGGIKFPTAECHSLTTQAYPRKDDTTTIAVNTSTVLTLIAQPRLQQKLLFEACTLGSISHSAALISAVS